MFILSQLEDTVRIAPQDLGRPVAAAVESSLVASFLDKVVSGLGLVVTLYDILSIGDGHVYHSDGGAHYRVEFRLVVFRPFQEETLVGRVLDMDEEGIHVDLGFFKDILIPHSSMYRACSWDAEEKAWMWNVDEDQYLYFERGLRIRFRAQSVRFLAVPTLADQAKQREEGQAVVGTAERPFVPMQVVGRTDGDGLGMMHWYVDGEEG